MFDIPPLIQIEIVGEYDHGENLVSTIAESYRTGNAGDGGIFVIPGENVVRIRTGESSEKLPIAGTLGIASYAIPPPNTGFFGYGFVRSDNPHRFAAHLNGA